MLNLIILVSLLKMPRCFYYRMEAYDYSHSMITGFFYDYLVGVFNQLKHTTIGNYYPI